MKQKGWKINPQESELLALDAYLASRRDSLVAAGASVLDAHGLLGKAALICGGVYLGTAVLIPKERAMPIIDQALGEFHRIADEAN